MTHTQLRKARARLGLSVAQMAAMLAAHPQTLRRWEAGPKWQSAEQIDERAERLVGAYLDGYRPKDWPG